MWWGEKGIQAVIDTATVIVIVIAVLLPLPKGLCMMHAIISHDSNEKKKVWE